MTSRWRLPGRSPRLSSSKYLLPLALVATQFVPHLYLFPVLSTCLELCPGVAHGAMNDYAHVAGGSLKFKGGGGADKCVCSDLTVEQDEGSPADTAGRRRRSLTRPLIA